MLADISALATRHSLLATSQPKPGVPSNMPVQAPGPQQTDASVDSRIESLCQRGCHEVRQAIATLERGGDLPETQGLTADGRRLLLGELQSVMAVYGNACRIG
jgi:hypothetical protein